MNAQEVQLVRWAGNTIAIALILALAVAFPPLLLGLPIIAVKHWLRRGQRQRRLQSYVGKDCLEAHRRELQYPDIVQEQLQNMTGRDGRE